MATLLYVKQVKAKEKGRIQFEAEFDDRPSASDVQNAQIKAGWHPGGYGGPCEVTKINDPEKWIVTWSCSNNSD